MIKALLSIFLLTGFVLAQSEQPPAHPAIDQSNDPNAQKAQVLLQQMIQALGGDAYLKITDIEQEGRTSSFYHGQPTGSVALFWRFVKLPDRDRIELTKQRDWVILYIGNDGYEVTFRGARKLDEKDVKEYVQRRHYSLDSVLRDWIKAPGTAFFYDGDAFVDNKQVDNVTIMNARDESVTIAIDRMTHLPVKKSFKTRNPEDRELDEDAEVYGNYRMEGNFNTAHVITRLKNDEMVSERFLTKVIYNQNLPDSMFVPATAVKRK